MALLTAVATVLIAGALPATPARASVVYAPGSLDFQSQGQSMWGSDPAFQKSDTIFEGGEWTNKGFDFGGIAGQEHDPWCLGCDSRTGARLWLNSSGKVGVQLGYSIDSGSVDTTADFGAKAILPDSVSANTFFNIATQSNLDHGTIATQSPDISASVSAIMQLSGSIGGEACFIPFGCSSSQSSLPNININQTIATIDPNAVNFFPGIRADGEPLAQLPLVGGSLTLSTGLGVPGFEISDDHGTTLFSTVPEGEPTNDLGELDFNVPNVATSGSGAGPTVTSSGEDDLLALNVDLDGLLTAGIEAATGVPVPFGTDIELGSLGSVHIDLVDVDAGPYLNFTQGFEFDPDLWVHLDFSNPVDVEGYGLQTSWTGLWDALPAFAISQTTTFTPTFFLDATLNNNTGLVLGGKGTWELLQLSGSLGPLTIPSWSLNSALGWGDEMFNIEGQPWSIFNQTFQLGGFNNVLAPSFTLTLDQDSGGGPESVPEPGNLLLLGLGLAVLAGLRKVGSRTEKDGRAASRA